MNIAQAKCITLAAYLERQGLSPQKSRMGGHKLWYHSPIRGRSKFFEHAQDTTKLVDMRSYYAGYGELNAWLLGRKL